MARAPHRKSGTRESRGREAARLRRDRKIYRFLRLMTVYSESLHRLAGVPADTVSVYLGKPEIPGIPKLTPFPITQQENGRAMPRWEDLSQWMKVQVVGMAYRGNFLTFNIRIHPDLEQKWGQLERDPLKEMRDRLRKELDRSVGRGREFFFVIEGWSAATNSPTYLHVHGGAAIYDPGDEAKIRIAAARAAGNGLKGYKPIARAVHTAIFRVEQAAWANYLFKAARRMDARLSYKRLVMSQSLTAHCRLVWETITRNENEWREPY